MPEKNIQEIIQASFTKILGHDDFELKNETTAKDIDGWDSITHMMIINDIEEKLGIKFKLMDLMGLKNIEDLNHIISSKLG
ncbi:acyl carrier protein [Costertonia aggregata]|uniref:Acyl carrier protein n=1 Tax=Costertonia aggregata TaxID=343403 RepID=A0A7H9ATE0_9FLAO|nr:acyl carrier protein [Costertonia aggregata]QLG46686.1 acyl carrier protein [Costertonia aggregata]